MSKAVNMALEWQLLHRDADKEQVLAEIAGRRAELGLSSQMTQK
jgi:hypothetical protein